MTNDLLDLLQSSLPSWRELWDEKESLFQNYRNLIKSCVILPDEEMQINIATALILINSKACPNACPIGFFVGSKGSGKSTLSLIANKIRGYDQIFGPADTFASLRNEMNKRKWADLNEQGAQGKKEGTIEKDGYFLAWDNLNADVLKFNQSLYSSLLLQGAYRSTGLAQIASTNGENIVFNVFGLKMITTINFYLKDPWFEELRDRCIPILFARNDERANELISLENYSWDGFSFLYEEFWSNSLNKLRFARAYQTAIKCDPPKNIQGRRWHMTLPLIVSFAVYSEGDIKGCVEDALEITSSYWKWLDETIGKRSLNAEILLSWLSDSEELVQLRLKSKVTGSKGISSSEDGRLIGLPDEISCSVVHGFLDAQRKAGNLDIDRMTVSVISALMGEIGYRKSSVDGNAFWVLN